MEFKDNLKRIMKEQKLYSKDLAEKCHAEESTISHWRQGKALPQLPLFADLAAALGVSMEELYYGTKKPKCVPVEISAKYEISNDTSVPEEIRRSEAVFNLRKGLMDKLLDYVVFEENYDPKTMTTTWYAKIDICDITLK